MKWSFIQLLKMSLKIIKAGLFDTIQDMGRYGYQHLGINPGGCMDGYAAHLANSLLGKDAGSAVIEMHFPAAMILFEEDALICITGADMTPAINEYVIPLNQPVRINKNDVLAFRGLRAGARCYLSVLYDFKIEKWLGSWSTNVLAGAGGFKGRLLRRDDVIEFDERSVEISVPKAFGTDIYKEKVQFIRGHEYSCLDEKSQKTFELNNFTITKNSNRMGYRLAGDPMLRTDKEELISSPVTFGTIQLLPDGQLIILMADHQTTGGYPRIGTVISADLPLLAQKKTGDIIRFVETDIINAEKLYIEQRKNLS